ncbi:MAG: hypothetical protein AAF752_04325 [Bacteroidota bacterium]
MTRLTSLVVGVLALLLVGCQVASQPATQYPDRQTLRERLYESERPILIVHGDDERLQARAEEIQRGARWVQFDVIAASDAVEDSLRGRPVLLLGTAATNRWTRTFSEQLPLSFTDSSFVFHGDAYAGPNQIVQLFYPSPLDSNYPVQVVSGNDDAVLARASFDLGRGDFYVSENGRGLVFGLFGENWTFDDASFRDLRPHLVLDTPLAVIYTHADPLSADSARRHADRIERVRADLARIAGERSEARIELHVHASTEDKGLSTGTDRLAHADVDQNAAHVIVRGQLRGDTGFAPALLLARDVLGEPQLAALETGLAMHLSEGWGRQGIAHWAGRLHDAGMALPLRVLLDNEQIQQASPLIAPVTAGAFVRFLIEQEGEAAFGRQYGTWTAEALTPLQEAFDAYLSALVPARPEPQRTLERYQAGFNHAHEGYQFYNGYGSTLSTEALRAQADLGATAVALVPYSYQRDGGVPTPYRFPNNTGDESDEAVVTDRYVAAELGMDVMLKPQIWLPRGQWPGEIIMTTEADWDQFFAYYGRWIDHYAFLAELHDFEVFCLMTEMSQTIDAHEEPWLEIIDRTRRMYRGALTAAGNWDTKFDHPRFWEALDYVGINAYRSLSERDDPTDEDLLDGARAVVAGIADMSERIGRPVLFTELGYTSTPTPWLRPYEYSGNKPIDLDAQRRAYAAMSEAIAGQPWARGVYWWKWPSFMSYGGEDSNGFTPAGKPAEKVFEAFARKSSEL